MRILALDSSAGPASAALLEDGKLIAEFYMHTKQTHSQTLMPMLEQVLRLTGVSLGDVDALAVSNGPGSFTGVRIGVACIKGLAMARDIPCAAVSTLRAMAENLRHENCVICAVMDARVGQVYNAIFEARNGEITRLTEDRALTITELQEECAAYGDKLVLVGDGAVLCHKAFREFGARIAVENARYQRASGVALAAAELVKIGKTVSGEALRPAYLRLPQAERELKAKQAAKGIQGNLGGQA